MISVAANAESNSSYMSLLVLVVVRMIGGAVLFKLQASPQMVLCEWAGGLGTSIVALHEFYCMISVLVHVCLIPVAQYLVKLGIL